MAASITNLGIFALFRNSNGMLSAGRLSSNGRVRKAPIGIVQSIHIIKCRAIHYRYNRTEGSDAIFNQQVKTADT